MTGLRIPIEAALLASLSFTPAVGAAEYHVATNGFDAATGTKNAPFKTIQRAADVMQPGDACIVHVGTYREWVKPPRGGESEEQRITFKAAPGEDVVIKGSERVASWKKQGSVWRAELADTLFGKQNPFKRNLAGEWLHFGTNYHLGDIYLDGVSLKEKLTRDEVQATPMSWLVEPADKRTILHAHFGDADPNARLTEINVRECVFFPVKKGLGYITLDGFTFAQAAPQWAYWNAYEEAAVGTCFGYRWIIQNCRFTDARCVALVCGNDPCKATEGQDIRGVGRHVVRHNHFTCCGEAAIHGNWGWAGSLIEGNLIEDINTKNEFGGMETGGMKIHYAVDVTVRGNVVRRVFGRKPADYTYKWGPEFTGIWIDWGAQGTRVTGNVVHDTEALSLFVQNSHGSPVLVDNNVFDHGVRVNTEGVVFAHNLFANCRWHITKGAAGPYWKPHSGERAGAGPVPMAHLKWWNNIFATRGLESLSSATGYTSDWNVFYGGAKMTAWGDSNSRVETLDANMKFRSLPDGVEISFTANDAPRELKAPLITRDFVGTFALTNQGLEDADGKPIAIDRDIRNSPRDNARPAAGPLEDVHRGVNTIRIRTGAPSP
jgi:alpha-N-arabinofuranosidase